MMVYCSLYEQTSIEGPVKLSLNPWYKWIDQEWWLGHPRVTWKSLATFLIRVLQSHCHQWCINDCLVSAYIMSFDLSNFCQVLKRIWVLSLEDLSEVMTPLKRGQTAYILGELCKDVKTMLPLKLFNGTYIGPTHRNILNVFPEVWMQW